MIDNITLILQSTLEWITTIFDFLMENELTRVLVLIPLVIFIILSILRIILKFVHQNDNKTND